MSISNRTYNESTTSRHVKMLYRPSLLHDLSSNRSTASQRSRVRVWTATGRFSCFFVIFVALLSRRRRLKLTRAWRNSRIPVWRHSRSCDGDYHGNAICQTGEWSDAIYRTSLFHARLTDNFIADDVRVKQDMNWTVLGGIVKLGQIKDMFFVCKRSLCRPIQRQLCDNKLLRNCNRQLKTKKPSSRWAFALQPHVCDYLLSAAATPGEQSFQRSCRNVNKFLIKGCFWIYVTYYSLYSSCCNTDLQCHPRSIVFVWSEKAYAIFH